MTHDYKGTLDALNKWNCIDRRLNHKAREFGRDQAELFLECNLETIRSALKLAQETEQLRKERDELARAVLEYNQLVIKRPMKNLEAVILAKKVVGE